MTFSITRRCFILFFQISKEMILLLIGAFGLVGALLLIKSGVLGAAVLPF